MDSQSTTPSLMGFFGIWGTIFAVVFALNILTGEIENSIEKLQGLKRPIQEKLLQCPGEVEKAQMIYLLQRIEDTKPMNACGYFEIGRSTLTSMLSVRLGIFEISKNRISILLLSLTYIIILVQFKMSADGCNCIDPLIMNSNTTIAN